MKSDPVRVFITKFALTRGIFIVTATRCNGGVVVGSGATGKFYRTHHCHKNLGDAITKANAMRDAKVISLRRQAEALGKATEWPIVEEP